jgi:hypothetical protein
MKHVDRATKLLGTATKEATIDRALDVVLMDESIVHAHRVARAVGGFKDAFRKS